VVHSLSIDGDENDLPDQGHGYLRPIRWYRNVSTTVAFAAKPDMSAHHAVTRRQGGFYGRWLTNVGTFRVYLQNYLRQHPDIHPDLTCLVRQLQPTREGLPLEIYVFTKETDWGAYEKVQADIFDHIISIFPEFELRLFQDPSEFDYHQADEVFSHRIDHQATLGLVVGVASDELTLLSNMVDEQNEYLASHPRARVETAAAKVDKEIEEKNLSHRVNAVVEDREIILRQI